MDRLSFSISESSSEQIFSHLSLCDEDFIPPLSSRLNVMLYAQKLARRAIRFECWHEQELVGMVAVYHSDDTREAFITSVSVRADFRHKGVAKHLLGLALAFGDERSILRSHLEVNRESEGARRLYGYFGFAPISEDETILAMVRPRPL